MKTIIFRCKLAAVAVASCFTITSAFANPTGATVVNGQVGFATQGSTLTVTNSPSAIINWQQFSINTGETTRFIQQSAQSAILNRVVGQDPSQLLGSLLSNGRVYLINPNGILFGQGAVIDVGGLVASTLKLSDADFLAGRLNFTDGAGAGGINNQGSITTPTGGNVYLIAPDITNSGVITSPQGEILLAAGHTVNLMDTTNPNVQVTLSAPATQAVNLGSLIARSGKVGIYGALIDQQGTVSADAAVVGDGGKIVLKATGDAMIGGSLSARGGQNGGDGGFIETSAHNVLLDNPTITATASYGKGGTWLIDPTDVLMDAAYNAPIVTSLNAGTNVTVATAAAGGQLGDITVAANIVKTAGANATLTLQAHNNIIVNGGVTISSTAGALGVVFNADSDGVGGGNIQMNSGSSIVTNGGNITFAGGVGGLGAAVGTAPPGSLWSGAAEGIYLNGAILNAGGGNIVMRGTGAAGIPAGGDGIYITSSSVVQTSGAGSITLNGTGGAGGAGSSFNSGVRFGTSAAVSSVNGAISITGQGGAGNNGSNYGVYVHNSATITSTGTATITLNGTGGAGTSYNYGVRLSSGMQINSVNGAISITGQGAGTGTGNYGIIHTNTSGAITSTGLADITLNGTGAGGAMGIYAQNGIGGASSTGNILLRSLNGSGMTLSGAAINTTGNVALNAVGGGAITQINGSITAAGLRVLGDTTASAVTLNSAANHVITLAGNLAGAASSLAYTDSGAFAIGSVTSFDGTAVTTTTGMAINNGDFTLVANNMGNITLNAGSAINTGTGAVNLTATGGNLNINGNVSAGTFTLNGGTWNQVSATLPSFTVNDFRITGGTFIRALGGNGSVATPYQLTDIYGVQGMGSAGMLGKSYVLANNIDATGTVNWNAGAGFVPLTLSGTFDGLSHTITNLFINQPSMGDVGLFGSANGVIQNVGLVGGSVTGNTWVGALVGILQSGSINHAYSTASVNGINEVGGLVGNLQPNNSITNSYASGNVTTINGTGQFGGTPGSWFGGLVGWNNGAITNSYATGNVNGSTTGVNVGGLVGIHQSFPGSVITNSYSTGLVSGASVVGGLVGLNNSGAIVGSFWDTQTSGTTVGIGGGILTGPTGMTTAQMQQQTTYTGWDFVNTWGISPGNYPFLLGVGGPVTPPPPPPPPSVLNAVNFGTGEINNAMTVEGVVQTIYFGNEANKGKKDDKPVCK